MSAGTHDDTFPARFPNIFVDYPLGQMCVGDKLWTNWNKALLKLWQTQLNFTVFCASSPCGVSSAHLNYTKHLMIRSVYRFHVYYHERRILKKIQVPLPHETGFNTTDNPYTESEFLKICEDYGVPNDPMRYRDEKFYWTYQHGVDWSDDYISQDSMTWWIIEKSDGFTDVGLYRISESVRAYAYLILSSQASARSSIIGNTASALTSQSALLNNFENAVNRRVNIQEDIIHLLDRTETNIIFIWSGKVILGEAKPSPNITLPDQINMILGEVLSNKCFIIPATLSPVPSHALLIQT